VPTSELDMLAKEGQGGESTAPRERRKGGGGRDRPDASGDGSPALPDLLAVEELVPLPTEFPTSTTEGVLPSFDGTVAIGKHYFPFTEDLRSCLP